jgi:hypothetical protein
MDEEWFKVWLGQSLEPSYVYFSIACFVVFRAIVAVLQHSAELKCWFHRRRHARWLREAGRGS